jgi:chromosome segregation ATPase
MGIFDEDQARAARSLGLARASLNAVIQWERSLQQELVQQEELIAALTAQLPVLQANLVQAGLNVGRLQNAVNERSRELDALALQEPVPTVVQANPAYPAWEQQVADLHQATINAWSAASALQPAVDQAQAAYDSTSELAVEPFLGNGKPNPRYAAWEERMADLRRALDRAKANQATAQQAATAMQATYDSARNSPPSQWIAVTNPDHTQWRQRMDALTSALNYSRNGLAAANAGVADIQRQIDTANTNLQAAPAHIERLRATIESAHREIAEHNGAVAAAQAGVDRVERWKAVLAGSTADLTAVGEVVSELTTRLTLAEDEWREAEEAALSADDALWRMVNRVDDLRRRQPEAEAAVTNLQSAKSKSDQANRDVEKYQAKKPW